MNSRNNIAPPDRTEGNSRAPGPTAGPDWLVEAKLAPPAPPADYLRRESLDPVLDSVPERRLTVLQAPAGFGKTAVLAELARRRGEAGEAVAWLSLDEDDTPEVFGLYLAGAFRRAGLHIPDPADGDGDGAPRFGRLVGLLAHAIEAHSAPCLLALDEVDRLPRPAVDLVDLLLKRSPGSLRIVLAMRRNPGLDLVPSVLDGGAVVVDSGQFLFSNSEIARLLGGCRPRCEVEAVGERTGGWPVAVVIERAAGGEGTAADSAKADLLGNFVGARLLRGFSAEDRAALFDVALFDSIRADVVDAVLGSSAPRLRVESLPMLENLLLPVAGERGALRLHPAVKDYCAGQLVLEDVARKRLLHGKIAAELVRRGRIKAAWRHAGDADDPHLVGRLVEQVGVCGLWLREGKSSLAAASEALTAEITAEYPRAALLRCVHLRFSAKLEAARALYEAVLHRTAEFTRDRKGGDPEALAVDGAFAEAALAGGPGQPVRSGVLDALRPPAQTPARLTERDRALLGARNLLHCISCHERGRFQESRRFGEQARALLATRFRYGQIVASIYLGMTAMAEGQVPEAADWYRRARRRAGLSFPDSPGFKTSLDILSMELVVERNREGRIQLCPLEEPTGLRGGCHGLYAAGIGVSADLARRREDDAAAIRYLHEVMDVVRAEDWTALLPFVASLLARYLTVSGRAEQAEQVWNDYSLPTEEEQLLDLEGQSWRTMEALASGRVLLLAARERAAAAASLADALCRISAERGMIRTQLRALGLAMAVAHGAEREDQALLRLAQLLRLTRRVDYYGALASHHRVSRILLRKLIGDDGYRDLRQAAGLVLARLEASATPEFSQHDLELLADVRQGLCNSEIAACLGIGKEGVRYHLKNIYRKTGTDSRDSAVRYAEERGLLP